MYTSCSKIHPILDCALGVSDTRPSMVGCVRMRGLGTEATSWSTLMPHTISRGGCPMCPKHGVWELSEFPEIRGTLVLMNLYGLGLDP